MSDAAKAHQGAAVLLAVIGASATPPVAPTYLPRRYPVSRAVRLVTGRIW